MKKKKIYKSKNDIPYIKFIEYAESVKGLPESVVLEITNRVFNCDSAEQFLKALSINKPFRFKYKINLNFKNAYDFVDIDTTYLEGDYLTFLKLILKPRYFFKKINFDKISIAEVEYIKGVFEGFKLDLKNKYEYLYNPPLRISSNVNTQGVFERQAFADHYGPYMEMAYLLCSGDFTKFDKVMSWDLDRFLFQGEYLIRKRDIENIK